MTPQEKARELFDKFIDVIPANNNKDFDTFVKVDIESTKQCAIIAVDELIDSCGNVPINSDNVYGFGTSNYWQQVKTEIEKL